MAVAKRYRNPEMRQVGKEQFAKALDIIALAANDEYFLTSAAPSATVSGVSETVITVSGFAATTAPNANPCSLAIVGLDAADDDWTAVSADLVFTDQFGDRLAKTYAATNSSGTWTINTSDAIATVISSTITITGTVTGSDRIFIGYVKRYGLGVRIAATTDVKLKAFDGAVDAGTVTVKGSTYTIAGTPDAAKITRLHIVSSAY